MSLKQHWEAIKEAWNQETKRRQTSAQNAYEADFLPAAVEILVKPPSPAGRLSLWLIVFASLFALVWSFLSQIETVAVGMGKIAPEGRLRSIEVAQVSTIKALHIRPGQHVRQGALLLEFDPELANADLASADAQARASLAARNRSSALLDGVNSDLTGANSSLYLAQLAQLSQKRSSLAQRLAGARAELLGIEADIERLEKTSAHSFSRYQSFQELEAKGYGARLRTIEAEQEYINQTQSLAATRAKKIQSEAQIAELQFAISELGSQFRISAAQEKTKTEADSLIADASVKKAEILLDRTKILSPVSGTIHEVFVNTIGSVVEPAKPIMTIVPDGETLLVEAMILNKDIGYITKGQRVVIKLDAYPFTRHGHLEGIVQTIFPDSVADENLGLVYPVRIKLNKEQKSMRHNRWRIAPGMSGQVEIITGKRRIIDFLLSPIARATSEAAREP
jgi:hemolysin D